MAISYSDALRIIEATANGMTDFRSDEELIEIDCALGRTISADVYTNAETPAADTSAMDGYAVCSGSTSTASIQTPVVLQVGGIVAAGDPGIRLLDEEHEHADVSELYGLGAAGFPPCVEIMTGARFPEPLCANDHHWNFDACVRIEDIEPVPGALSSRPLIQISAPVKPGQNRRVAGEDYAIGDRVVRKGEVLGPQHIMALASLGICKVKVSRRPRVAIASTGNEVFRASLPTDKHQIRDANEPYLTASLRSMRIDTIDLGVVSDSALHLEQVVRNAAKNAAIDVIVTSGAVSCGRYDFVKDAIARLGGEVKFHRVAVRPGHPVLFGTIALFGRNIAYFGLPGNPMACVACFRFFVVPYLRVLHKLPREIFEAGRVLSKRYNGTREERLNLMVGMPSNLCTFRLAVDVQEDDTRGLRLVENQASHKIKPILDADCWVIMPPSSAGFKVGTLLATVPLNPNGADFMQSTLPYVPVARPQKDLQERT